VIYGDLCVREKSTGKHGQPPIMEVNRGFPVDFPRQANDIRIPVWEPDGWVDWLQSGAPGR